MILRVIKWIGSNLGTILLAFVLALVVWVSSVTANDPNQELEYPVALPIEHVGQPSDLVIINDVPDTVRVTFNAPRTIQEELWANRTLVHASIDLEGMEAGEHTVPVEVTADKRPYRITFQDPAEVTVVLESLVTQTYSITLQVTGEPAFGYAAGDLAFQPKSVDVTGPASQVAQVAEVRGSFSIDGATQNVSTRVRLEPLTEEGEVVTDVDLNPESIQVEQSVALLGSYRNLIVRVVTEGQLANGYRLTNITATPPTILVFSSNPSTLNDIPGYAETTPITIEGAEDDFEVYASLELPEGVTVAGDQKVLVQVSIAAIETSVRLSLPIDIIGLRPGLTAEPATDTVEVILSGPVPVLDALRPESIRIVIDMTGKGLGTYQEEITAPLLPDRVQLDSILPEVVEVNVITASTPTPTVPAPTATATQAPQ